MRYGAIADTPDEQGFVESRRFPRAQFDTVVPPLQAQAIMAAVRCGVFEALGGAPCRVDELASVLDLDPDTLELLLRLLRGSDYLTTDGDGRFALTERSRLELLQASSYRVTPWVTLFGMWWDRLAGIDTLLKTGAGLDMHHEMQNPTEWALYQAAMLASARRAAPLVARMVPVKAGATRLLDIAGSHGMYGALIARAHPPMRAEVLDLPEAVEHASKLGSAEGLDDVVSWRGGDALSDDLGDGYDVVFLGHILHHFAPPVIADLLARVRKAMTPGGTVAIWDIPQPGETTRDVIADAYALFFRLTSSARCYRADEYCMWLTDAGFTAVHAEEAPMFLLVTGRS
jgi:predicted O-methyltransferase YrrM